MIKDERQYKITRAQAARFTDALESLRQRPGADNRLRPLIPKALEDAIISLLADLEGELPEYESLKSGEFQWDLLSMVADLQSILIKARIARGLSQKELAEKIELKEQQIQRYEATDYASANLTRIKEVASAFGVQVDCPTTTPDTA